MFDAGLIVGFIRCRRSTLIVLEGNYASEGGGRLDQSRGRARGGEGDREKDGGCLAETQSCPTNRIIINYDTVRARRKRRAKKTSRGGDLAATNKWKRSAKEQRV